MLPIYLFPLNSLNLVIMLLSRQHCKELPTYVSLDPGNLQYIDDDGKNHGLSSSNSSIKDSKDGTPKQVCSLDCLIF